MTETIRGEAQIQGSVWTNYYASSTVVGWSSFVVTFIYYKKIGKLVFVYFYLDGTSNATTVSFTLPYNSAAAPTPANQTVIRIMDNGVNPASPGYSNLVAGGNTVTCQKDLNTTSAWTASGRKYVIGSFFYESA